MKKGLTESLKNQILQQLISERLIYKKQRIYYSSLQRDNANDSEDNEPTFIGLYEPFKNLCTEYEFAKILGISSSIFCERKKDDSANRFYIKVFDKNQLSDEEKKKCVNDIATRYNIRKSQNKRQGGIYYSIIQMDNANDLNYVGIFFTDIYKELPQEIKTKCTEEELAQFLGIKNFAQFKSSTNRYRGNLNIEINENNENEIEQKVLRYVVQKYGLFKGQKMYYSQKDIPEGTPDVVSLTKMYRNVVTELSVDLTLKEFANILGVNTIYRASRYMKILLNQNLSEEEETKLFEYLVSTYQLTGNYAKKGIFYSKVQKDNSKDTSYDGPYMVEMYENLPDEWRAKCTIHEMMKIIGVVLKNCGQPTWKTSKDKIPILKNQMLTEEEESEISDLITRLEFQKIAYSIGEDSFNKLFERYKKIVRKRICSNVRNFYVFSKNDETQTRLYGAYNKYGEIKENARCFW